ncbi:hypothetical protein SDC9_164708 [bioreactor metagenome]|uniref:Uncharacterized protein n=1 Tax=bioreactor metagenome TaxID=1076179 RepID=A0A645FSC6_9ZZZZ
MQTQMMNNLFIRQITKADVIEIDLASDLLQHQSFCDIRRFRRFI